MARKIIYLINPISGTRGKSSLQEMIIRRTREQNIEFDILPTNAEGDYDFLLPFIEKQQVTDIVICGGDGTVNAVAAALMGTDVRIGIIPMGSGNGLAFAARIPKSPAKALDIVFAGRASAIDGFTINDQFSCMLCGIGFDASVAYEFARQKRRGLQTYVRVSLKNFFRVSPWSFRIHFPDQAYSFSADAFFISIANGNQFGNNFTIAPKASLHDGLVDIVVVKKMNKLRLVFSVLNQILGNNAVLKTSELEQQAAGKKNILYFQTSSLIIDNPQRAPLHIDGDPSTTSERFVIRIVPLAFKLIQP
ncbi:MAG TPA: YegS/Rv2252/BmrU family lipid kinase [Puia sp.]|nr:YegS/Rv2252/BmrU family lipid kinase [Puia sp.]